MRNGEGILRSVEGVARAFSGARTSPALSTSRYRKGSELEQRRHRRRHAIVAVADDAHGDILVLRRTQSSARLRTTHGGPELVPNHSALDTPRGLRRFSPATLHWFP